MCLTAGVLVFQTSSSCGFGSDTQRNSYCLLTAVISSRDALTCPRSKARHGWCAYGGCHGQATQQVNEG